MSKRPGSSEDDVERWLKSVEHEASMIVYRVTEEIDELTTAMGATEKALVASRMQLREKLRQENDEFCKKMMARLEELGFGPFESPAQLDGFMHETAATEMFRAGSEPGEMSPRLEAYWDWEEFVRHQQMEHAVELSERPTMFSRYGTIIAMHALLESALQAFCQLAKERRKSRLAVEDLAKGGSDGFKERRYLEKVHALEVDGALWDAIGPLVFVRNRIAHSSGRVHGVRSARDFALLTQTPGLSVQGTVVEARRFVDGSLRVEKEFVESFEKAIYALLKALETKLSDWDGLRAVRKGHRQD